MKCELAQCKREGNPAQVAGLRGIYCDPCLTVLLGTPRDTFRGIYKETPSGAWQNEDKSVTLNSDQAISMAMAMEREEILRIIDGWGESDDPFDKLIERIATNGPKSAALLQLWRKG